MLLTIDADEFMDVVMPFVKAGDPRGLAQAVKLRWRTREVCRLLENSRGDVRKLAAVTLGFVGDGQVVTCLTKALRDPDPHVNAMAEHGLWSIWFRSGHAASVRPFREGIALLGDEAYRDAIEKFHQTVALDPQFSEGHNQCAIAHFFLSEWNESLKQAREAARLQPSHFGAIAGMGHCFTQMGELKKALTCYRRSLAINPHMPGIARAIERLESLPPDRSTTDQTHTDQIFG